MGGWAVVASFSEQFEQYEELTRGVDYLWRGEREGDTSDTDRSIAIGQQSRSSPTQTGLADAHSDFTYTSTDFSLAQPLLFSQALRKYFGLPYDTAHKFETM